MRLLSRRANSELRESAEVAVKLCITCISIGGCEKLRQLLEAGPGSRVLIEMRCLLTTTTEARSLHYPGRACRFWFEFDLVLCRLRFWAITASQCKCRGSKRYI